MASFEARQRKMRRMSSKARHPHHGYDPMKRSLPLDALERGSGRHWHACSALFHAAHPATRTGLESSRGRLHKRLAALRSRILAQEMWLREKGPFS